MNKKIRIALFALSLAISFSCGDVVKTTYGNRNLYIFFNDAPKEREYLMVLEIRSEKRKFSYEFSENPKLNMLFEYNSNSETLKFGFDEYKAVKGSEIMIEEISGLPFKKYDLTEPIIDGTGPILFNSEYGVLAIGNVLAPDFVYLPHNGELKTANLIREKLHQ
ncbi:hypothetical protein [Sediminicola luteus]|uniref:Lipoprotein n=1 Tax=Sediminicola luteus TaxID=319238 RepID=A0A2A4G4X3_9FLAO|nr:hypothetical protein [Sediminicola luteus]PCE63481.1 hypothetical protein B7P33_14825 [Sediminicola luteus]